jgi:hypothetical protein
MPMIQPMSILDLLTQMPLGYGGSSRRSREENVTGIVGMTVLPALVFSIVLFTSVHEHSTVSLVLLPLACAAVTFVLCRWLRTGFAWAISATLGCALFSLTASAAALLLAGLAAFYSSF